MKRVLVTGGSGFIGRQCLPILAEQGFEVHVVSSKTPEGRVEDVHWHRANLLDPFQAHALMAEVQPNYLLHLAWVTTPGEYWSSLDNVHWVRASLDLLQSFIGCGGVRIVMAGTCAEYDWKRGLCSELHTPLVPNSLYGASKHALQVLLEHAAIRANVSAAWGRIFYVYGPHEHRARLIPYVIRSLLRGRVAICSDGRQIRDLLFVRDVADALVRLLHSEVRGPINVASGEPTVLADLIRDIGAKLERRELVAMGERPREADDAPVVLADVERLRNELCWSPRYDRDSAIQETIRWWRNAIDSGPDESALKPI